ASAAVGRALHFAIVAALLALWGDRVIALVSGYWRVLAVFCLLILLGLCIAHHLPETTLFPPRGMRGQGAGTIAMSTRSSRNGGTRHLCTAQSLCGQSG